MDTASFFREGTLRICSSLNVDEMLHNCLIFLKQYMPLDTINFLILEPDNKAFKIIAGVSDSLNMKNFVDIPCPLSEESQSFIKSHCGMVYICDSITKLPPIKEVASFLGLRNLIGIGMPLLIKGEQLGLVGIASTMEKPLTVEHAQLLKLLHEPFAIAISNYLRHKEVLCLKEQLADDNKYLQKELYRMSGDEIIGAKFGLSEVMEQVHHVALVDSPVLLLGETGVGKEVLANFIHYSSRRCEGPLIKLNCGAIPEGLIDSELFGHEKGAFTGATIMKRGRFERADGGTIFLDEIGELPPAAQVRLLRVFQEGFIERVGGTEQVPINVRVIAATHRDLELMVKKGGFREDLWYRINVFPVTIPPLRERKSDIPAFVYHFIELKAREMNLHIQPVLALGALACLQQYDWPGNVRELANVVERELILNRARKTKEPLQFDEVKSKLSKHQSSLSTQSLTQSDTPMDINSILHTHITQVLQMTNGKIQGPTGAAALLGVHPNTLRHRLRKLGISFGRTSNYSN